MSSKGRATRPFTYAYEIFQWPVLTHARAPKEARPARTHKEASTHAHGHRRNPGRACTEDKAHARTQEEARTRTQQEEARARTHE